MKMHSIRIGPSVKYRPLPVSGVSTITNSNIPTASLWKRLQLHLVKVVLVVGLVLTIVNLFNYRSDIKLAFPRNSSNNTNRGTHLQSPILHLSGSSAPSSSSSSSEATFFNFGPKQLRPTVDPKFHSNTHDNALQTPEEVRHGVDGGSAAITRTIHLMTKMDKSVLFMDNSTEAKSFTESELEEQTKTSRGHESAPRNLFLNSTKHGPATSSSPPKSSKVTKSPREPTNDPLKNDKMTPESSSATPSSSSDTPENTTTIPSNATELKTDPTTPVSRIKFSGYIETTSTRSVTFLSKLMTKLGINSCPEDPPDLHGPLEVNLTKDTLVEVETRLRPLLLPGGWYRPVECNAKDRVAIIIPYRDREQHLPILLKNLHPLLMRQQVNYGIFVVEETKADPFNRASLMNVGFLEANKMANWDCFIFHDVDLIPLDDRNLYRCPEQPRHMSVAIDVFDYKLPYFTIFGGVSALTKQQFHSVNGFSNLFWGWGGEDDDMSNRLRYMGYHISRYPMNIARYTMLSHAKALPNPKRYEKLSNGLKRYENDGLNSVKYQLVDNKRLPLFTWLLVKLQPEQSIAGKLGAQTAAATTDDNQHSFLKYTIVIVLATILICIFKALLFSS